ncbi:hypothetical protein D3C73_1515100 [compost metagenome]
MGAELDFPAVKEGAIDLDTHQVTSGRQILATGQCFQGQRTGIARMVLQLAHEG